MLTHVNLRADAARAAGSAATTPIAALGASYLKALMERSNQPVAKSLRQHIENGAGYTAVDFAKAQQL